MEVVTQPPENKQPDGYILPAKTNGKKDKVKAQKGRKKSRGTKRRASESKKRKRRKYPPSTQSSEQGANEVDTGKDDIHNMPEPRDTKNKHKGVLAARVDDGDDSGIDSFIFPEDAVVSADSRRKVMLVTLVWTLLFCFCNLPVSLTGIVIASFRLTNADVCLSGLSTW
eukprot:CAMPEP_0168524134 /NCGR_PEP_ID=MMETSP0405-20121227/10451_1 /TAXON_ID=498012 /ORGANISM="Trichosphaerium sp, Strain Am-I-7 wt" /LENGTH=168 /DNA_ID=CAMNT_0008546247 /DNA_START=106 /DNA_END=609 /DNA_ORIENTATION=-